MIGKSYLIIASHHLYNLTQKLDFQNYTYLANSVLFSKLTSKLRAPFSLGAYLRVIAPAGNTALFEEILKRWRAVGNTVFNLTGPGCEHQTSQSRDQRVTA